MCKILQILCNRKGSIFQMSQMPCKMRVFISTMQADVAECWRYCKYHANAVVCFSAFLALMVSPVFFLLGFAKLYLLLDFMALLVFTATKATRIRKSQPRPTPKQRPQHQQLLVRSSSNSTTNNNHNNSNNGNNGNNQKQLLQLQLQLRNYKNYNNCNNYNCNKNSKTNQNPQLPDNNQQSTTTCK